MTMIVRSNQHFVWPAVVLVAASWVGCGGQGTAPRAGTEDGPPPGYTRYQIAPVTVMPGETLLKTDWVGLPFDHDVVITDVRGLQGPVGHHVFIYSTSELRPMGTRQDGFPTNITDLQLVGGIGGTGGGILKAPPGTGLHVPPHRALIMSAHWINATTQPVTTSAYIDLKVEAPAPGIVIASSFGFPALDLDIEPGYDTAVQLICPVDRDIPLILFSNHMHSHGIRARTELVHGGAVEVLKDDPVWNPEWTAAPNFERRPLSAPTALVAGDQVKVTCVWRNNGQTALHYPDEMCTFFGYYIGDRDLSWLPCTTVKAAP